MTTVRGALLLVAVVLTLPGIWGPYAASATPSAAGSLALPPGEYLPSDAQCASRVVVAGSERRPGNTPFNQTRGQQKHLPGGFLSRVTGDFVGTTDEIIQWAACKWGIDADVVRAQAVVESTWDMTHLGDFTVDRRWCAPGYASGDNAEPGCPQSVGILQVRYRYHPAAFPEAARSTAYNLDYALAVWRTCFEGRESWLADHPPASGYRAGDLWGCLGRWYTGQWRDDTALYYIDQVHEHFYARTWETY